MLGMGAALAVVAATRRRLRKRRQAKLAAIGARINLDIDQNFGRRSGNWSDLAVKPR